MVRNFLTVGNRLKGDLSPRANPESQCGRRPDQNYRTECSDPTPHGTVGNSGQSGEGTGLMSHSVSDRARTGSHAHSLPDSRCVSGPPLFSSHGLWHV